MREERFVAADLRSLRGLVMEILEDIGNNRHVDYMSHLAEDWAPRARQVLALIGDVEESEAENARLWEKDVKWSAEAERLRIALSQCREALALEKAGSRHYQEALRNLVAYGHVNIFQVANALAMPVNEAELALKEIGNSHE